MGGYVFDHGADRRLPLSRRTAALILLVVALAGATLWAGLRSDVQAAPSPASRAAIEHDAPGPRGLALAAAAGDGELVEALLAGGIDPNANDGDGPSALRASIRAGETGIARRLLAAGAKLAGKHRAIASELHDAAVHDDAALIGLLIEAGAAVDERALDLDGATALHIASENGCDHSVDALIHAGADSGARDARGFTPLARAALLSRTPTVQLLVEHGVDVQIRDARGRTALQLAAAAGDLGGVRVLLEARADPRVVDDHGWTALHEAAAHGRATVVRALIRGLGRRTLNARTSRGATALHLAVRRGESDCVRALLEVDADSNIRDADGRLARDFAPIEGLGEPWDRLRPAPPMPAARRPDPVLLDATERRPIICLCSHPARALRGPLVLLELAIWEDGATVYAPWRADGTRDYVAGVISPSAVRGVLLDLEEIDWLDAQAPAFDPKEQDCVELCIERRGAWTRTIWNEVEHPEARLARPSRAALADWMLGRARARDVLRAARPATTQAMSFVLVSGSFRGLAFQDGGHASWMPDAIR